MTNLSENQQWKLFLALGAILGIGGLYKIYAARKLKSEDRPTINEAQKHGFTDNGSDLSLSRNATNIAIFLSLSDNPFASEFKQNKNQFFRTFIYPVLKDLVTTKINTMTSEEHENFWNNTIAAIIENNMDTNIQLSKDNDDYLRIIKRQLTEGSFDEPKVVQKILNSLNQVLGDDEQDIQQQASKASLQAESTPQSNKQALNKIVTQSLANTLGFKSTDSLNLSHPNYKINFYNVAILLQQEDVAWKKLDELIPSYSSLQLNKETAICNIFKSRVVPILTMFPHQDLKYDIKSVVDTTIQKYNTEFSFKNTSEIYQEKITQYLNSCEVKNN